MIWINWLKCLKELKELFFVLQAEGRDANSDKIVHKPISCYVIKETFPKELFFSKKKKWRRLEFFCSPIVRSLVMLKIKSNIGYWRLCTEWFAEWPYCVDNDWCKEIKHIWSGTWTFRLELSLKSSMWTETSIFDIKCER